MKVVYARTYWMLTLFLDVSLNTLILTVHKLMFVIVGLPGAHRKMSCFVAFDALC